MRPLSEINAYQTMGSIIGSGGTVTSTGTALAGTIEPYVGLLVNVGATAAGAVVATLQSSAALASGYSDVATYAAGSIAGAYYVPAGSLIGQYMRTVVTATGGTANVATSVLGKLRTITT